MGEGKYVFKLSPQCWGGQTETWSHCVCHLGPQPLLSLSLQFSRESVMTLGF